MVILANEYTQRDSDGNRNYLGDSDGDGDVVIGVLVLMPRLCYSVARGATHAPNNVHLNDQQSPLVALLVPELHSVAGGE